MARTFGAQRSGSTSTFWVWPLVLAVGLALLAIPMWSDPDVADVRRNLLLASAGAAVIGAAVFWFTRYRVVIGDAGIRIRRGLTTMDLGRPKKLRCGQYENDVNLANRGILRGEVTVPVTHVWVAVEGANGQKVTFQGRRGMLHRKLDWPTARPPQSHHVFGGDAVKLREAIGAQITAD